MMGFGAKYEFQEPALGGGVWAGAHVEYSGAGYFPNVEMDKVKRIRF